MIKLIVELLGASRRLAQAKEHPLALDEGATYRDVLRQLACDFPTLVGPVILPENSDLVPAYMMNIDGRHAVVDLDIPAQDGQRLILMFMEAGG
ncbi:MAG: ubiquitin family protein [Anaerolineae bacterium]